MRVRGLDVVGQLEVAELRTPDRALLLLDRQRVPAVEVVQVLLDDDVAAAGEGRVLVADQDRGDRRLALRVLGAVDEAEQVALVEGPEAVHLVDHPARPAAAGHQPLRELEAQVQAVGADVEQQVARRRRRAGAGRRRQLGERVQAGRPRRAEQPVPDAGADADDAGQLALRERGSRPSA